MPDRHETIRAVEDYLKTREEARRLRPIWSAQAIGVCIIVLGILLAGLSWLASGEAGLLRPLGFYLIPLGVALLLLGLRGGAKYRVVETTRYPQQTGEVVDMFFQVLGENYLWIVVAAMALWLFLIAIWA